MGVEGDNESTFRSPNRQNDGQGLEPGPLKAIGAGIPAPTTIYNATASAPRPGRRRSAPPQRTLSKIEPL